MPRKVKPCGSFVTVPSSTLCYNRKFHSDATSEVSKNDSPAQLMSNENNHNDNKGTISMSGCG